MVKVKDMIVGEKYLVGSYIKKLTQKDLAGAGGSGNQEPTYNLYFDNDNDNKITKDWDDDYKEGPIGGSKKGGRKSKKGGRKSKKGGRKSKKVGRKSNRHR
jgi:hypothetical protein